VILTDELIRNKIVPRYEGKINPNALFSIQVASDKDNPIWLKAQKKFYKL